VKLLRHTPSLVTLHATILTNLDPLLLGLTATNESNSLVPELKQLTIAIIANQWTTSSVRPLSTMITSRTRCLDASGCKLKHLTIVIPIAEGVVDVSVDLEMELRALHMSKVEWRRPLSGASGGGIVKYVWRQASDPQGLQLEGS